MGKNEQEDVPLRDAEDERAEATRPDAPAAREKPEMTADQARVELARERDEFARAADDAAGTFAAETAQGLERIEKSKDSPRKYKRSRGTSPRPRRT